MVFGAGIEKLRGYHLPHRISWFPRRFPTFEVQGDVSEAKPFDMVQARSPEAECANHNRIRTQRLPFKPIRMPTLRQGPCPEAGRAEVKSTYGNLATFGCNPWRESRVSRSLS